MKKLFVLLLVTISLITIGCDNSSTNPTNQSKYPTKLGNQWEYNTTHTIEYYDSTGNIDSVDLLDLGNTIVRIDTENDTVNETSNLVLFSSYEVSTPDSIAKSWYSNSDSGLYVMAYSGAGRSQPVIPKINAENNSVNIAFSNSSIMLPDLYSFINSNLADSIQYFDPPRKVLAYPLRIGVRWFELIDPFHSERFVDEKISVEVPAGIYNCYTVKTDWDLNIELTDYMNLDDGLIKRVVYSDSLGITTPGNPDPSMYARFTSISQLINKSF